ncbi:site-specific integrase [Burkholderia glumae]|uniref:site-specific integrase n=1 Tax=Burkholderia glumae TaxID=337 RepID=UPI0020CC3CAE|nr:site-specific integrase [Burkholderia glumae]MCQ0031248.1 site-specific integrase [Burkholderia glumae]MCQ0038833.1 site-specific integrase [Burkholderia glumae]
MASIIRKPLKSGGCSWQAFVTMKGFPRVVATFATESEAVEFGKAQEAEFARLRKTNAPSLPFKATPPKGNLLKDRVADLVSSFIISGRSTSKNRRNNKAVILLVGSARVCDIDEYWIEDYIAKARATKSQQDKPYAFRTIRDQLLLIKKSIRARARELRTPRPPFPFSTLMFPRGWDAPRKRRLKPEEQKALFGAFLKIEGVRRDHWWLMTHLALLTGARLQEIALAEWSDFEIEHCRWTVPAHRCKTRKERVIPLGRRARFILRLLLKRKTPESSRVFHAMGTPGACSQQFRKLAQAAGVVGFRFHDLRCEAISRMYLQQDGLTEREIMVIVGHSSLEQTRAYVEMNATEVASRMR